jgi:hypothetical protein
MDPIQEFHRHANECRRMARVATSAESRDAWKSMAERWVRCAAEFETAQGEARPLPLAAGTHPIRLLRQGVRGNDGKSSGIDSEKTVRRNPHQPQPPLGFSLLKSAKPDLEFFWTVRSAISLPWRYLSLRPTTLDAGFAGSESGVRLRTR